MTQSSLDNFRRIEKRFENRKIGEDFITDRHIHKSSMCLDIIVIDTNFNDFREIGARCAIVYSAILSSRLRKRNVYVFELMNNINPKSSSSCTDNLLSSSLAQTLKSLLLV
ncbi:hypothetical protein Tco_0924981 [Tanacetum coccineum]|uniref:Uncharacterized protein n=1 Tax=Tanacetum coccineum TaxID=301880 RepID=A0ABQ5D878_9ASTR